MTSSTDCAVAAHAFPWLEIPEAPGACCYDPSATSGFSRLKFISCSEADTKGEQRIVGINVAVVEGKVEMPFPSLKGLSELQSLRLNGIGLTGPIPNLSTDHPHLTHLTIMNAGLKGAFPSSLLKLKGLTHLDIRKNGLEGELPGQLFEALPSLEVLRLASNGFTGALPSNWCKTFPESLSMLDLSRNSLTGSLDTVDTSTCASNHLHLIDLSRNPLNTTLPPTFMADASELEVFACDGCGLHGALPASLGALTNVSVQLSNNYLSGPIAHSFFNGKGNIANNCFAKPAAKHDRRTAFWQRNARQRSHDECEPHLASTTDASALVFQNLEPRHALPLPATTRPFNRAEATQPGSPNDNPGGEDPTPPADPNANGGGGNNNGRIVTIAGSVAGAVAFLLLVAIVGWFTARHFRLKKQKPPPEFLGSSALNAAAERGATEPPPPDSPKVPQRNSVAVPSSPSSASSPAAAPAAEGWDTASAGGSPAFLVAHTGAPTQAELSAAAAAAAAAEGYASPAFMVPHTAGPTQAEMAAAVEAYGAAYATPYGMMAYNPATGAWEHQQAYQPYYQGYYQYYDPAAAAQAAQVANDTRSVGSRENVEPVQSDNKRLSLA
ncbi:hypothetical protein HDU96_002531 [Phlyctochytrium bullatum]|nr:hypothetical protein HDU96_002531 [Phlyctochytrium bullatum]